MPCTHLSTPSSMEGISCCLLACFASSRSTNSRPRHASRGNTSSHTISRCSGMPLAALCNSIDTTPTHRCSLRSLSPSHRHRVVEFIAQSFVSFCHSGPSGGLPVGLSHQDLRDLDLRRVPTAGRQGEGGGEGACSVWVPVLTSLLRSSSKRSLASAVRY
jgi:hypothetical protein